MHSTDRLIAEAVTSAKLSHRIDRNCAFLTARHFAVHACNEHMFNFLHMVLPILPDLDLPLTLR